MNPTEVLARLTSHVEFKVWQDLHPESRLAHLFIMPGDASVQVGYCNTDNSITTFFIENNDIKIAADQEAFHKPKSKIESLNLARVKVSSEDALSKASAVLKESYKMPSLKAFAVLQCIKGMGAVYNITFLTASFKTVNVKVSASKGDVLKHELIDIISSVAGEKRPAA